MSPMAEATSPDAEASLVDALTRVLARACRELGNAGHPSDAARLAAEGWSVLRHRFPDDAERLNGTLHYLSRVEQKLETIERQP
ncbi:MAG: hypothetical protein ABI035_04300 [Gemmatimonadaceae bacterium]